MARNMEDSPPPPPPLTDESQTGATRERDNERKSFELHIKMLKKYFKNFYLNERH